ncbi:Uncharacterized protein OS=Planctomyces maris DSM 8797 GN=PM8797T_31408 PE=4 SV=1: AAA_25 [Gemmataceae bacterium]|nr:Uncharacterized protein OS=Planctomyces maris DSM 8797 GN=PM8797T_31408 PE=4 SV=1: AAA_25 [Gemmataceae bacterium]VTT99075.1 Uncharacterized protein OS=Planctomyces maris DSM 8797 GN=PM8797T_31408 PE=4 SV=1: AAA_25 [Gemmataceae bacterium]
MAETIRRSTKTDPCPCCGSGTKGCSTKFDGAVWCRGEPRTEWKCVAKGDTFNTYRHESDTTNLRTRTADMPAPEKQPRPAETKPEQDWAEFMKDVEVQFRDEHRADLSRALGLPVAALDVLPIGWRTESNDRTCWVFPESNAAGKVIGVGRRYPKPVNVDGVPLTKMSMGKRGLTIPRTWNASDPGPVFVVEGPSDVLAMSLCGLAVIGRPSNSGGVAHLAELLAACGHRDVYIVGEHDLKPNGDWPGRDGARTVAEKLAAALGRPVCWSMPPPDYKDARVWVQALAAGFGEAEDWHGAGREIAAHLTGCATTCTPPAAVTDPPKPPDPPTPPKPRFNIIGSAAFAGGDFRPEWLVSRALVRNQPGVIAGPSKALKTNLSIDLAVSLAAGVPFVGKFEVPKPVRVVIVSGESGEHTLQETANRVCKAKGLDLAALNDNLGWCFTLPTFSDLGVMAEFAGALAGLKAEVVIIDPVYLALGNVDAKNMFEAGAAFRVVAEVLLKTGCTPLLVHHANRQLQVGEPMELTHLAYSGLDQFARQFVLLNRRERYKGDGTHDLWATIGGSAGHGGLWSIHAEEGVVDEHFRGRKWDVTVQTRAEVQGEHEAERESASREKVRKKRLAEETEILNAIDAEVQSGEAAATEGRIRARCSYGQAKVKQIITDLLDTGHVVEVPFKKAIGNNAKRDITGYKRARFEHE